MSDNGASGGVGGRLPVWIPDGAQLYLSHTESGLSLRELARQRGVHASTVLRQVRRYESRRDDPLVDQALEGLRSAQTVKTAHMAKLGADRMRAEQTTQGKGPTGGTVAGRLPRNAEEIAREALRVLGRMAETAAVLAVSPDMQTAVVLRQGAAGKTQRLCTVERAVAQAFALNDWIACDTTKAATERVAVYRLTVAGRAALRRMQSGDGSDAFGAQHRKMEMRNIDDADGRMRLRVNVAESPIVMLGRKRDKDGKPYLEPDLISVAERLREDFELAQMGPRVTQNWDRFLTAGDRGGFRTDTGLAQGPRAARERVLLAMSDLGPGLGDVVLRVCCFVEGIETTERHMGWAARSGKIVLRIALQRLKRHYADRYGPSGPLFG